MERLVFVAGPMEGRSFDLTSHETSVGRQPGNRLQLLGDRCVSRRHARIIRQGGVLYLEDLGSRNGTLVNGEKVNGTVQIALGDQIQIAYHFMRLELSPLAFGPGVPFVAEPAVSYESEAPKKDRLWVLGLVPSILIAPFGIMKYGLEGLELLPFALVLIGLALAFVGLIRFYRPSEETSTFERAFLQTVSGSALAILAALWLNAIR